MIPEKESLKLFETYEALQTRIGKHQGIPIKGGSGDFNEYAPKFRKALKHLTSHYRPHLIKHQNYWRWSFSIPFEYDDGRYVGVKLVVEWHRNSPSDRTIEYLTIKTTRKAWEKGHEPPCLWKR